MSYTRSLLVSISLGAMILASSVQAEALPMRPRVGLALSGGGARGAAHLGVLRVLEELRIPIDCIAGTSMGSIIGGLYASGLSPDEIQAEIGKIDWTSMFNDAPPRKDEPFRPQPLRLDQHPAREGHHRFAGDKEDDRFQRHQDNDARPLDRFVDTADEGQQLVLDVAQSPLLNVGPTSD